LNKTYRALIILTAFYFVVPLSLEAATGPKAARETAPGQEKVNVKDAFEPWGYFGATFSDVTSEMAGYYGDRLHYRRRPGGRGRASKR
jgi:hypothetical protein